MAPLLEANRPALRPPSFKVEVDNIEVATFRKVSGIQERDRGRSSIRRAATTMTIYKPDRADQVRSNAHLSRSKLHRGPASFYKWRDEVQTSGGAGTISRRNGAIVQLDRDGKTRDLPLELSEGLAGALGNGATSTPRRGRRAIETIRSHWLRRADRQGRKQSHGVPCGKASGTGEADVREHSRDDDEDGPSLESILWGAAERWSDEPGLVDREEFADYIFEAWGGESPTEDFVSRFFDGDRDRRAPRATWRRRCRARPAAPCTSTISI